MFDYLSIYGIYQSCHMCEEPCHFDSVTHGKLIFCSEACLDAYKRWAVIGGANRRVERPLYGYPRHENLPRGF